MKKRVFSPTPHGRHLASPSGNFGPAYIIFSGAIFRQKRRFFGKSGNIIIQTRVWIRTEIQIAFRTPKKGPCFLDPFFALFTRSRVSQTFADCETELATDSSTRRANVVDRRRRRVLRRLSTSAARVYFTFL